MPDLFNPLSEMAKTLGYWPTLILFGAGLLAFVIKVSLDTHKDLETGRNQRAKAIGEAYEKLASIKKLNLNEIEYASARKNILRQYGISEAEFLHGNVPRPLSAPEKIMWSSLGGATFSILANAIVVAALPVVLRQGLEVLLVIVGMCALSGFMVGLAVEKQVGSSARFYLLGMVGTAVALPSLFMFIIVTGNY